MVIYPIIGDSIIDSHAVVDIMVGENPYCIQTDLSNKYAFVPALGSDCILQYHFNENNGKTTPSHPDRVKTDSGAGPLHLTFHPKLDVVYLVNELNSTINTYTLSADIGTLREVQNITTFPADFSGTNSCADIHITPDGKYLYSGGEKSGNIVTHKILMDGLLERLNTYIAGNSVSWILVSRIPRFIFMYFDITYSKYSNASIISRYTPSNPASKIFFI